MAVLRTEGFYVTLWLAGVISLTLLASNASANVAFSSDDNFVLTSNTALSDATFTRLITDVSHPSSFEDTETESSDTIAGHLAPPVPEPVQTSAEAPLATAKVSFDVAFSVPSLFASGHCFFIPQVSAADGQFYWLTVAKPTVAAKPIAAAVKP
jgi:hypothetical protein